MAGSTSKNDSFIFTSMTDLMTSLAVIFILLLVVYLNKTHEQTTKVSSNKKEEIKNILQRKNIEAQDDPEDPLSFIIRLHDETLQFETNRFEIKPNGKKFLNNFIPDLTESLCQDQKSIESIFIQGFTDHIGDDEFNLWLSQQRAFRVFTYALKHTSLDQERKDCLLKLTSTNGKGERNLLPYTFGQGFALAGQEDTDKSRRVEIKVRVKSYEQRQISSS